MIKAIALNQVNDAIIKDIIEIELLSFPKGWPRDDEKHYKRKLSNQNNIKIILESDGKRVGYLLAIPHSIAVRELEDSDSELKEDSKKYYIETVGILPDFRGLKGFPMMIQRLIEECKKRGINKISMHARIVNGFSKKIQQNMKVIEIRRVERWKYYNYEEPTDYIEVNI